MPPRHFFDNIGLILAFAIFVSIVIIVCAESKEVVRCLISRCIVFDIKVMIRKIEVI